MEYFDLRTLLDNNVKYLLNMNIANLNEDDKFKRNFFESICENTDKRLPKEIGDMLVKENNDPNYTILIHRTSRAMKEDLFKNGLIITGGNNLDYTTSRYDENITLVVSVINAYGYKNVYNNNARCVIIKIPNTALEYTDGKTKPILYKTNNIAEQGGGMAVVDGEYQTVLLPEYILGTVEFQQGKITEFVKNPNYTEIHDYKNDGLVCPQETLDSYRKQHMNTEKIYLHSTDISEYIKKLREENKVINDIICTQNTNYMKTKRATRTESDIKKYSKKEMPFSKFSQMSKKIKNFFTKDKSKEENLNNVDR